MYERRRRTDVKILERSTIGRYRHKETKKDKFYQEISKATQSVRLSSINLTADVLLLITDFSCYP